MDLSVHDGAHQWHWCTSAVPYDSLGELVTSLLTLLRTPQVTITTRWNMEPAELKFRFARQHDAAELTVYRYPDARRTHDVQVHLTDIQASYRALVLPFWRALRRLEATPRLLAPWPHPFPTTQFQHVTNNLRQAKPQ
jgi:hypothetical protein